MFFFLIFIKKSSGNSIQLKNRFLLNHKFDRFSECNSLFNFVFSSKTMVDGQCMTSSSYVVGAFQICRGTNSRSNCIICREREFSEEIQDKQKNLDQICDHCKFYGHIKDNRFRLVGHFVYWKFKKKSDPPEN